MRRLHGDNQRYYALVYSFLKQIEAADPGDLFIILRTGDDRVHGMRIPDAGFSGGFAWYVNRLLKSLPAREPVREMVCLWVSPEAPLGGQPDAPAGDLLDGLLARLPENGRA
jgi:hypothetical protein